MKKLFVILSFLISLMCISSQSWGLPDCPKDKKAHKNNCFGVYINKFGTKYEGEWKNNKYHGKGEINFVISGSPQAKYIGEWKEGSYFKGTLIYPNGDKYNGEFQNDERNGTGTLYFSNGDKYIGKWKDNKRNGKGSILYSNGDKYEGEWKNDNRHGLGVNYYLNGFKFVGEWKNDQQTDKGKFSRHDILKISKNKTVISKDVKKSPCPENKNQNKDNCFGIFNYPYGGVYSGEYKKNVRNGYGTIIYKSTGYKYVGHWKNDKKNGKGSEFWSKSGDKFVGEYQNGKRHGKGIEELKNGKSIKGVWNNGKLVKPNNKIIKSNNKKIDISFLEKNFSQCINNSTLNECFYDTRNKKQTGKVGYFKNNKLWEGYSFKEG